MAEYIARTRTNYFRVTDIEKLKSILGKCDLSGYNADSITIITKDDKEPKNGSLVGFYCFGTIEGYPIMPEKPDVDREDYDEEDDDFEEDCDEYDLDAFLNDLADCIAPGDACIITETGYENMRQLYGGATVVTSEHKTKYMDLRTIAQKEARKLLKNPNWKTTMEC